jgi:DNA polymerase-4
MDCFFAAVEVLDNPSLTGLPVIVGGTGSRGVVASCSYEARVTGIRSAMPMGEARRRCPTAVILPGRHDRYSEVSRDLHKVFATFTPVIEPISIDEAFLDVSGSHRIFGSSETIGHEIRSSVRQSLQLDCSVGVARSKLIAKLASRAAKPIVTKSGTRPGPGVIVVTQADELTFLQPRPVRDLWGVGPRTAERLARFGVSTIGDVARLDEASLVRILGRASGTQLHALAWARDDRPVVASQPAKSISHEETFATDRNDAEFLRRELVRLSDSVASRLRASGVIGRTVTLKVRFADFATITRSHSLPGPLMSGAEIARVSAALLGGVDVSGGVRLIGVSVTSLEPAESAPGRQLVLAGLENSLAGEGDDAALRDSGEHRRDVELAVDEIRRRYGAGAVGPAAAITDAGLRVKRLGDAPWGPDAPESAAGGQRSDSPAASQSGDPADDDEDAAATPPGPRGNAGPARGSGLRRGGPIRRTTPLRRSR